MKNSNYIQTEEKNLIRDPDSKALLSSNKKELIIHRNKIQQIKQMEDSKTEIDAIKKDISHLDQELSEIKEMLREALRGK